MKETRVIKVTGVQRDHKGEENRIELVTMGNYYKKNDAIYIVYEETEISGMEGTTTTLKIQGQDRVSLKRYGSARANMIFEEGKEFHSEYQTLYGDFKMEIKTNHLNIQINDDNHKGQLEIHYDLNIIGLVETENQLKIQLI